MLKNFARKYLPENCFFIFLFVAAKYLGIAGALFAPAIAATVCVLVDELYINNLK